MKKYLCLIGVLGVLLCNTANSYAQKVAVKTNLLYDATTTMNLGLEIGLGKKWSLDLSGNYNPWKFDDETRLRHWGVQPELRYWLCEKFNGHFLGLHGHYAKYNVGGMSFLSDNMDHSKYPCATCGTVQKSEKKNYFGPTKAAVSIIYIIK